MTQVAEWDWVELEVPSTACKHGKVDCDRCGTSSKRDEVHGTTKGKGRVRTALEKKP